MNDQPSASVGQTKVFPLNGDRGSLENFYRVMTDLHSSLDLNHVVNRLLDHAVAFLPFDRAVVFLKENQHLRLVASRGFLPQELPTIPLPTEAYHYLSHLTTGEDFFLFREDQDVSGGHYLGLMAVASWLAVPVIHQNETVGVLAFDRLEGNLFEEGDAQWAVAFSKTVAPAVCNARSFEEVQKQAVTDGLTGVYNRRHFFILAERELKRSQRYRTSVTLLTIGIDSLKEVNASRGWGAGDQVLSQVAARVQALLRGTDILGRVAGLVVLLSPSGDEESRAVAERILNSVSKSPISVEESVIPLALSIGLSASGSRPHLIGLFQESEAALLRAQQAGGNNIAQWKVP